MAVFWDIFIVAALSPITNYVNNKKCRLLEQHSENSNDRELFASHWVNQTRIYGNFVRNYLNIEQSDNTNNTNTANTANTPNTPTTHTPLSMDDVLEDEY